jgi:transcriptional regulator with XRE-family HTH domain
MQHFAARLTAVRESRGITPYRLAVDAGLSKQGALNLELPGADPKLSTLCHLAYALGVSIHDLVPDLGPVQGRASKNRAVRAAIARSEARKLYREKVKPELEAVIRLLHCDRSPYAPSVLSGRAQVLKREIENVFNLLERELENLFHVVE